MKRFDHSSLYRKIIVPWHETETACFILIGFMCLIFLFAISGLSVARESAEFHEHIWVPFLIMGMSVFVIISVSIRLTKRYVYRFKNRYLKIFNQDNLK